MRHLHQPDTISSLSQQQVNEDVNLSDSNNNNSNNNNSNNNNELDSNGAVPGELKLMAIYKRALNMNGAFL